MTELQSTTFRALAARANYLAQDRAEIQFAVKELSRRMSKPRRVGMKQLIKFGRYLKGKPRVVNLFRYQKSWKILDVWRVCCPPRQAPAMMLELAMAITSWLVMADRP